MVGTTIIKEALLWQEQEEENPEKVKPDVRDEAPAKPGPARR
jgi:hypothetical protein